MARHPEGKEQIMARLTPEHREKLGQMLIGMGYSYHRGESQLPSWTEFLEAIAEGEIILYKKV